MKQTKQYTDKSDYWNTPKKLYDYVLKKGFIDYNEANSMITPFNANAKLYNKQNIYINPPFSLINKREFKDLIDELIERDNTVLLLMPSRTDTKMFHHLLEYQPTIHFFKSRLKFNESKQSAPFPTLLLTLGKNKSNNSYHTIDLNDDLKFLD